MSSEDTNLPPLLQPAHDEAAYREARMEMDFIQRLRTKQPVATIALIAACVAVFGMEYLWADMGMNDNIVNMGVMVGEAVRQGEWWRLWAATFLHYGVLHIAMNMMVLWSLGRQMEGIMGSRRLLIIYALSGLAGNVPYLFTQQDVYGAGASGAIWGLLAGMYAVTLRPQGLMPPGIARNARGRLIQPLLINLAISFLPGIGLFAHLGGGVAGFVLVFSGVLGGPAEESAEWPGRSSWSGQWITWAAAALSAAMLVSVVWAMMAGKPWAA
jgi:rhomboid protease GluP